MKTTKTITIKETAFGWEIRNNYKVVGETVKFWDAYKIAEKVDATKKIVVKRVW